MEPDKLQGGLAVDGLPRSVSVPADGIDRARIGAGELGTAESTLRSVLATSARLMPAAGEAESKECTEDPCFGFTDPGTVYLCYFRSRQYTTKQIRELAQKFCDKETDADLKAILSQEAQLAADDMCVPKDKCHCAVTSSRLSAESDQLLSQADADALAKALRKSGRNSAEALDGADAQVPESKRVYIRIECNVTVDGKCAPTRKAV